MNNKNVYSLNNTFEGKIWVDWKGKERMVKWVQKFPAAKNRTFLLCGNPHALVPVCEVYLAVLVPVCTHVKDYGPCPVSQISGCGRLQIIHKSMEMAAFNGMSTQVCVFKGIVYVDWKHRIGHRPMFPKKHWPSDRQAKLTSVEP